MIRLLRPQKGALALYGLPGGYDSRYFLRQMIVGQGGSMTWTDPLWRLPRSRFALITRRLARQFGEVEVTTWGTTSIECVSACWTAKPESAADCECRCCAFNHGSEHPLGVEVIPGLSVFHEYTELVQIVRAP